MRQNFPETVTTGGPTPVTQEGANPAGVEWYFVLALTVWAAVAFVAAAGGAFESLPLPALPGLVFVGVAGPVALYYSRPDFRAYVRSIPPKHLTLFHVWRVPAGLAFLHYGSNGWLPETFVRNAGYGDIAIGLAVPLVLLLPAGRGKYLAFHALGLLDFAVAVGTGFAFSLLAMPLMENILTYPIVLIVAFGVCVTGALHVMTLDALLRTPRGTAARLGRRELQGVGRE